MMMDRKHRKALVICSIGLALFIVVLLLLAGFDLGNFTIRRGIHLG